MPLDEDEVTIWLAGDAPPCGHGEPSPDRFVYELVFHTGDPPRTVVVPEEALDERSRPLIERLTEMAFGSNER